MPPLPPTTQTLTTRLNQLSDANKATLHLIQRLSKLDFQPGSTPLNTEEGDVRVELSSEIHESLKQLDEELELLRQEVEDAVQGTGPNARRRDSDRDSERSRLAVLLARLTEDLKSSRTQFRRAQLSAKRAADAAKQKERQLLFSNLQSGTSTPTSTYTRHRRPNTQQLTEQEVITSASSDVTAALRRTQQLMQEELSRSRFAQETLEQSSAALADLGESYTDLSTLLSKSRNLVTTLLKSQKSDTWYLETTLYILTTTVLWLIFRRWLYGPITWLIIWPAKILIKVVFTAAPAIAGLAKGKSLDLEAQTTGLIIQPSATGKPPKIPTNANREPYIRVGAGGKGYINEDPNQKDPSPPGSLSEKIGKMAEENQNQNQGEEQVHPQFREHRTEEGNEEEKVVVRGDGTVLPKRGEAQKPNPKKKMWDADVEREKYEEMIKERLEKDTQSGGGEKVEQAGEVEGRREKDEL